MMDSQEDISMYQIDQSFTNQVLVEKDGNKEFYYLPCYIRFKAKSIDDIQIDCLSATIAGVMLVSIYYGDLSQKIVEQFLTENEVQNFNKFKPVILQFAKGDPIILLLGSGIIIKHHQEQKIFEFVIRKTFLCELEGELALTPFEILNLYLSLSLQTIHLNPEFNKGKKLSIRFNAMDTDIYMKINSTNDCKFGQYDLAEFYLAAKYTNNSIVPFGKELKHLQQEEKKFIKKENQNIVKEAAIGGISKIFIFETSENIENAFDIDKYESSLKQKKQKMNYNLKYFKEVHFRIPLYKYPTNTISIICIPLWVLGFFNLGIFFQSFDFSGRITNLATLLLAFIAFFPTIHAEIPPNPSVMLIDILIYLEIITCFLCFADSFIINLDPTNYVFDWSTNTFFIASLIIHLSTIFIVMVLMLVHKVYWEPRYNTIIQGKKKEEFIRETWGNYECDRIFTKYKNIIPLNHPRLQKAR